MAVKEISEESALSVVASFDQPVTLIDIAKQVGIHRSKIAGTIRTLAANGSLIEVRGDDDKAVMFKVAPGIHIPENVGSEATAKSPSKANEASKSVSQSSQTKAPSSEKADLAPNTSPVDQKPENLVHQILAMLFDRPLAKREIAEQFGDVENILNQMVKDNLVESEYIINDMTYQLTTSGYDTLEALNQKQFDHPASNKNASSEAIGSNKSTPPQTVEKKRRGRKPTEAGLAKKAAAEAKRQANALKKAAKETQKAPLNGTKKVEVAPHPAPAQPSHKSANEDGAMKMISELVEGLVAKRMNEIQEQSVVNRKEISQNLKTATDSLQSAIDALSRIQNLL